MTPNDLLLKHAHLIVKSLFHKTDQTYKQFLKYSHSSYNAEVSTNQYWKAVEGMEQTQLELQKLLDELVLMDEYTQWSEKLHQDRYKFVQKYDVVFEKYKGVVGSENDEYKKAKTHYS